MSYFCQKAIEMKIPLPEPTHICEKCGGGSWKKIKKGSEIEKYLIFCRCDVNPIFEHVFETSTPDTSEIDTSEIDTSEIDAPETIQEINRKEIPKHLRSRYKPKYHKDKKWSKEANVQED